MFWNTKKNTKIDAYLIGMIVAHNCDVIALCEYSNNIVNLLNALKEKGFQYQEITLNEKGRVRVIAKNYVRSENIIDSSYYSIINLGINSHNFLLAAVHLPSKLYISKQDQIEVARYLREEIEKAEGKINHKNTIIIGDFNFNPFEDAMIGACGIHAVPFKSISARQYRKIRGIEYGMFYNPMWKLLGNYSMAPGTYYYDNSEMINYFWNVFDQVVIRPELADYLELDTLRVITSTSKGNLLHNGKPNESISDHLPIYFELHEEEML